MQIILKIHKDGIIEFPVNYNYQFQSAIYALLGESPYYSNFLHNQGYGDAQRFKMFTFGSPQGEYKIIDKKIYFNEDFTLEIRSVSDEFCETIKTQPPIVIQSKTEENKTIPYSPTQREFYSLVDANFQNKYKAHFGHESLTNITLLPMGNFKKIVTSYKGTWITAYHGNFELHGSSQSLQFLYDTGLGMKNPQGFGMFDIL